MRYLSTRGNAAPQAFCDILLGGLAPDGGLYLPESWPVLTAEEWRALRGLPYPDLAARIIAPFTAGCIAPEVLLRLCRESYAGFDHAAIVPLVDLKVTSGGAPVT